MTDRARTRPIVRMALIMSLALTAVACGGKDPAAETAPTTPTDVSTAVETTAPPLTNAPTTTNPELVPVSGGSLTVAIESESTGYNPAADAWARGGHQVAHAIFDPLATLDAEGKVVPYLAESITANEDSTVWTITVRPGISFHNGEPLNAEALKANFDALRASVQYGSMLAQVSGLTVVDDLTLDIEMSAPWGSFANMLVGQIGSQIGYVAAPAMLADPDGGRNPIGTGPFKFVEWTPDDHLTVERNDEYWQGAPYLDEVIFRPIPDSTSRRAAFDAGDAQIYYTGSSSEIQEYQADDTKTVTIGTAVEPDMVMINTSKAPLDDVRVRRALVMSLDIDRLFEYLDGVGVKQPLDGPYPKDSFWHVDSDYPEYDPEGAAALIAEYEAEKGPVVFDFGGSADPFVTTYRELFQSMWADAGIEANILQNSQSENIAKVAGGDYQVMMWGGQGGGDPDSDYDYFHSGGLNWTRYTSPEIDAAMEAGRRLSDPEERKQQYAIVQEAYGRDVPYIWIGTNVMAVVTDNEVMGLTDFDLPDGTPGASVQAGVFFLKDVWLPQ